MAWFEKLKAYARHLKAEILALYLAARDPRTPWYAKLFMAGVVAYAMSPIDLIPDFVPVLGYLDDLILIPLGVALAIRMTPPDVLTECRAKARTSPPTRQGMPKKRNWIAGAIIIAIWVVLAILMVMWIYDKYSGASLN